MATTIKNVRHIVALQGTQTSDSSVDAKAPTTEIDFSPYNLFSHGTGANQANKRWRKTAELAATSVSFDLAGGEADEYGNTLTFTNVKVLTIKNTNTTTAKDLTISGTFMDNDLLGGGSSTVVLGPGGIFSVSSPVDGFTVTNTTGDVLTLNAGANTITYEISILGLA